MIPRFRPTARNLYYSIISKFAEEHQRVCLDGNTATFLADSPEEYKEFYRFQSTNSEISIIRETISEVMPGDTFVDVGSKVGLYTCLVGVSVPKVDIIAFEPHSKNAARIRENVSLNNLDATVHEVALSDHNGRESLYVQNEDPGTGTHSLKRVADTETLQVPAARLDTLINNGNIPSPDVVKIDVEGAENEVIHGMTDLSRESLPRTLVVEVHQSIASKPTDFLQYLRKVGYETSILGERGSEYHLQAKLSD